MWGIFMPAKLNKEKRRLYPIVRVGLPVTHEPYDEYLLDCEENETSIVGFSLKKKIYLNFLPDQD